MPSQSVRNVKAKYRVVGPKRVTVMVNKASMDKETLSLQQEPVEETKDMYMVYFPQGHSIRVERDELVRLKYHLKPRLVDMETGDVIDRGGDPYDFMTDNDAVEAEETPGMEIKLLPDDDELEMKAQEEALIQGKTRKTG